MCQCYTQKFIEFTGFDLFDQNVGMACANVRFIHSWISLALIYLITSGFDHGFDW